jgi:glycosyltransferase involved in cell wall biosynthesis
VGAAHDLIIEGENGYLVPENDPVALAAAIDSACASEQHSCALGAKARGTVQQWDYASTLAGFYSALSFCLRGKNSPADDSWRETGEELRAASDYI